jgi:DNA-directed RNA polymerase sigma subunit (sigma70/sigma32)
LEVLLKNRSHVKDYFMSQEEVAKALNMTRSEVQQTEYTALKKLKRSGKLRRYVGAKEN